MDYRPREILEIQALEDRLANDHDRNPLRRSPSDTGWGEGSYAAGCELLRHAVAALVVVTVW